MHCALHMLGHLHVGYMCVTVVHSPNTLMCSWVQGTRATHASIKRKCCQWLAQGRDCAVTGEQGVGSR